MNYRGTNAQLLEFVGETCVEELHGRASWDVLIQVIKKIREIEGDTYLWEIDGFGLRNALLYLNSEKVYEEVIEYINAYNKKHEN